ncbi:peroxidase-like [Ostrinia nubilalis]|uniref:peroxidase-like n=1 Tax=Ostrinia nubilalis TaxID=29057 RepID=UPI003082686C
MNCFNAFFVFMSIVFLVECGELFDRHSGKKIHEPDCARQCSIEVNPCTPHEGSRVDGTCNNYKHPTRGSARGPYLRMLKPDYGHMGTLRENKHGGSLPSARKVRTTLQTTGRVVDKKTFNMAAATFMEFVGSDVSQINGPLDYLRKRTYCCHHEGKKDPRCAPIPIPHDDPYLRVTDLHCMNYSRIETFQDIGCIPHDTQPEQINEQTPLLDLSTIYGVDDEHLNSIRMYEHGLLKEEKRRDRHVPTNETRDVCFQNRGHHPICYKFGNSEVANFDLPRTMLSIYFYREHNRIARELHELNPCWKDEKLFQVARQINIATFANIMLYELLPVLMGRKNLVHNGLMSEHVEYVNAYDESMEPLVYAEFELAKRFFRTIWDGRLKKYNDDYHYVGEFSYSDTFFRQELIEQHSNFEELNRGLFYQNAAQIDDIQDPDVSEKAYGEILKAHDRVAVDIQRGRDFGLPGYTSYRHVCGLKPVKHFHDLLDVMSAEKMEALMSLYQDVDDIDLMAGIMAEDLMHGTFVGPTLYCILARQMYLFRFWFERGQQYTSFTLPQLHEIRKTNMARLACDNAEGITHIQPQALLNVGHGNDHVPCNKIAKADLSKWYDDSCHHSHDYKPYGDDYKPYGNYHSQPYYGPRVSSYYSRYQ